MQKYGVQPFGWDHLSGSLDFGPTFAKASIYAPPFAKAMGRQAG